MAKKKVKKKTTGRRKRVSGMSLGKFSLSETMQKGLGLVLGAVGGMTLQRHATFIPQKAMSVLQLVGGVMVTHMKNPIVSAAGWGVAAAGAGGLATQTGLIHGIDEMVSGIMDEDGMGYMEQMEGMGNGMTLAGVSDEEIMSGMGNGTVLNGMSNGMVLNGYDSGYIPMSMG